MRLKERFDLDADGASMLWDLNDKQKLFRMWFTAVLAFGFDVR